MSMDTNPANDALAETYVLGAIIATKGRAFDDLDDLREEDFFWPAHGSLWALMLDMAQSGEPVEQSAVMMRVRDGAVRGMQWPEVSAIRDACATPANVTWYARKVKEAATLRRLEAVGLRIVDQCRTGADIGGITEQAVSYLADLDAPVASNGRWIGEIVEDVMEDAENGSGALPSLDWPYLDDMPPMPCGRLVILAGRPGLGKSTAGLDAARHAAIHLRRPVAFFSLEMSQAEVGARCAAAEAEIPLPNVQKGQMRDVDWQAWADHQGLILDAPLYVDDFPRADPAYIRAVCRRIVREKGDLGLVVVDYLQLMEDSGAPASKSRQQIVSEFSRSLTILAKELGTAPVLALAQLNRGPEQRGDKKPQIADLRESGSLEQDASQVILIHREDAYAKESPRAGEVDMLVAKNRGGPTTTVTLAAQLHYSRFKAMAPDPAKSYVRAS